MKRKPPGCEACPLYADGQGFVPGVFPAKARVLIVGQNPGSDEEEAGKPFVGKTGQEMTRTYLPLAGLARKDTAIDNAIRCRWLQPGKRKKTNKLPGGKLLQEALACCSQYDRVPESVDLIVAQGGVALQKFAGPKAKVHEWRGHLLPKEE